MTSRSDIAIKGWVKFLPASWLPYAQLARLDRPIGWWLLLLPSWWSIMTAGLIFEAEPIAIIRLMVLFWIGAVVMRGAGCVINDLWDRDLDRSVERTQDRALAAGLITPPQAFLFLAGLGLIGFLVLISLPIEAVIVGLCSLPLIVIYPLAKRITGFPQIVLSLTFSWGALLGWAAYGQYPDWTAGVIYIATCFWIFGYDTIYAIQDKSDDIKAGIKSSALTLGKKLKPAVAFSYGMMVLGLVSAGAMRNASAVYYLGLAAVALHLRHQIMQIDLDNPSIAGDLFRSNRNTGLILCLALMLELLL